MPAVSIVVPSRGGAQRLPVLLDSIAAQTDHDVEVVVVLDGDVDASADVLAARTDLPLQVIVFPENRGRAAALNAGFAAADGDILVRCDDDLELPASYVENQRLLHTGEARGVVGLCRNLFPDTGYARVYGFDADRRGREAAYAAGPQEAWLHWGANVSVRRADYDAVGGYDEAYSRYGWEDADWGYRLHALGRPVVVRRVLEAGHHVAATTTAGRAGRAYLSGRSRHRFETKHGAVLGDPLRVDGPWGRLVAAYAAGLDEREVARRGHRIDAGLARWPRPLARKRVALLVEAAARAGYLAASDADTGRTPTT